MKTIFTYSSFRTFVLTFVIAISTLNLAAQTTHQVAVVNFRFNPSQLTITAGDKVVWTNSTNMGHNVNGTKATFPSNPESFGNNVSLSWTYEYVFNTAGTYSYHCDPHADFGMTGSIIVNPGNSTATQELADKTGSFQLYPNPASQYIELRTPVNHEKITSLKVYSVVGNLIDQKIIARNAESLRYDVSGLKNGVYLLEINSGTQKDILRFLKK